MNTKETAETKNCSSTTQRNKAHKILIIGDSHVRNCASNVKSNIKGNFKFHGIIKPGAEAVIVTNSVKNEIKSLSKSDVVVFCGGANDVGRNNAAKALQQISIFIAHSENTNIILTTAPPRYNLMLSSCINSEIISFNRKLKKIIKAHNHTSLLDLMTTRNLYTTHGLHLNGQGKEKLANQIFHHVYAILKQEKDSSILLNWKERDQSGNSDIITSGWSTSGNPGKSDEKSSLKESKPEFEAKSGQQTSENYNIVCENSK